MVVVPASSLKAGPRVPPGLDELAACQPLPHLLWRIGEWQALARHELLPPLLDLGCGDGAFGRMLFPPGAACGMDRSWQAVRQARRWGVYRCAWVADARRLPFRDASWLTIVANSTLEHVADVDAALREVRRVLRPGGRCYITVPGEHFASLLFHAAWLRRIGARQLASAYGRWLNKYLTHLRCESVETWQTRLARADLNLLFAEALLPPRAVALWDACLPAQYVLRRVNNVLPWYRWLRRARRALLMRCLAALEMQPGEAGAVWLLAAG